MSETSEKSTSTVWIWVVGIIALAWNGMGVFNFFAQQDADTVSQLPEAYQAFISSRPDWVVWVFALSVFAGFIGAIALLVRHRLATSAFVLSAIGAALSVVGALVFNGGTAVLVPTLISVLVAAAFAWFSRRVIG